METLDIIMALGLLALGILLDVVILALVMRAYAKFIRPRWQVRRSLKLIDKYSARNAKAHLESKEEWEKVRRTVDEGMKDFE